MTPADLVGKILAELHRPLPYRLVADQDTSAASIFNHAQAQGEPEIQPHNVADDLSREPVAGIARMTVRFMPARMPASRHHSVNLAMPSH